MVPIRSKYEWEGAEIKVIEWTSVWDDRDAMEVRDVGKQGILRRREDVSQEPAEEKERRGICVRDSGGKNMMKKE